MEELIKQESQMEKMVKQLKPFVTTFSGALPTVCKHGDEVSVGGKIVSVMNMSDLIDGPEQKGVYITLDDGVGLTHVVIPEKAYNEYKELYNLEIGSVVIAKGKVFVVDTSSTFTPKKKDAYTVDNHKYKTTRVFSWSIKPLPEKVEEAV